MISVFCFFCFIEVAINKFLWNVMVYDLFKGPKIGLIGTITVTIILNSGILLLGVTKRL